MTQTLTPPNADDLSDLERFRPELTGYCYRMLGSAFDADDAVQEIMVRAWKAQSRFEGRSSVRTWMYRIATNVCLDSIAARGKRARPLDLSGTSYQPVEASLAGVRDATEWVEPIMEGWVIPAGQDPAEIAVARESIRLAFVAALQYLAPRQRAVLILRDVLRWPAAEVAELLDTTVAAVNSALQRAHAVLAQHQDGASADVYDPLDPDQSRLLNEYLKAFEAYDMKRFVQLLHADATQNMPPFEMWLSGADDVVAWMVGVGKECEGSRLLPIVVNGQPGAAQYRPSGPGGRHEPWSINLLDVRDGRIQGLTNFLDTRLFALFGLPQHPDDVVG